MKSIEEILIQQGVRPTAMRMLILEYLRKQSYAVDMNELEQVFDHADRITIYRTLKTFEEKGLVHEIADGTDAAKYAVCFEDCSENHHHDRHAHFSCDVCHETFCLPGKVNLNIIPKDFSVNDINIVAHGVCPHCRR